MVVVRIVMGGQNKKTFPFFRPRQRLCWQTEGQLQKSATTKSTPVPASTIVRKTKAKSVNSLLIRPITSGKPRLPGGRTLVNEQIVQAGRLKFHHEEWTKITSDKVILDIVKGYHIDSISVPFQDHPSKQPTLDKHKEIVLNALLTEPIQKGVIKRCAHEDGEFISLVFLRPKKNGNID